MQRARRWRTVLKWGLLVCAVGFATLAIATWRWVPGWMHLVTPPTCNIYVLDGVMFIEKFDVPVRWSGPPPEQELSLQRRQDYFPTPGARGLVPRWERQGVGVRVWLPMWIPFLLTFGPFLYLWHTDRKAARLAKRGACVSCGYNRVGLVAGAACPECGALPGGERERSGTM